MTDDSYTERQALKSVFPNAIQLLCIFHVLKNVWAHLWQPSSNVLLVDRSPLAILVRKLMYSSNEDDLQLNYEKFLEACICKLLTNLL